MRRGLTRSAMIGAIVGLVLMIVAVSEADVIRPGSRRLTRNYGTFAAIPDRGFDLTVREFSTEADPATRTCAVTLTMPAPAAN